MKLSCILVLLALTCGCAVHKKDELPDMLLAPENIIGDVHLERCNISKEPPECKRVKMKYRKGSERVVIRK